MKTVCAVIVGAVFGLAIAALGSIQVQAQKQSIIGDARVAPALESGKVRAHLDDVELEKIRVIMREEFDRRFALKVYTIENLRVPGKLEKQNLNVANTNPLRLDSQGRGWLYMGPGSYRLILYAPYQDTDVLQHCNGSAVGAIAWERDNVAGFGYDDKGVPMKVQSQFKTETGQPAAGYLLCSYKAGTGTPKATYREPYRAEK